MRSFFTTIDHDRLGTIEIEVLYEYDPGQKEVLWGDYPQPGFPASVEVQDTYLNGEEFELLDHTKELEDRCWDNYNEL